MRGGEGGFPTGAARVGAGGGDRKRAVFPPSMPTRLLDLDEFQALIGACGVQPGDDEKGRKMFMDCAKASRKIRRSVGDAILPEAFVAVCEKHGIEMAIKPTVAVSGGAL